jgi:hypothetical protein
MSTRHLTVDVSEESLDLLQRSVRQGNYASPDQAVDALLMQLSPDAILERPRICNSVQALQLLLLALLLPLQRTPAPTPPWENPAVTAFIPKMAPTPRRV